MKNENGIEKEGIDSSFWDGKRVLVTGHTGFKGSWMSLWLLQLGAQVCGYALPPAHSEDLFNVSGLKGKITHYEGDIRDLEQVEKVFREFQPEVVFHLAAQPLVRLSYEEPIMTYETNVMGTLHVLETVRRTPSVRSIVVITTDKCYENKETLQGYKESDPMGGYDPYSSSKACAEILTASYRNSFFSAEKDTAVASARAGNVIGGGDWAKDRIVPDCIRAIQQGGAVILRNPQAIRPWQFVLEPLRGYLILAQKLWQEGASYGEGWNFGPQEGTLSTVEQVAEMIVAAYGAGRIEVRNQKDAPHEAGLLCLDITKAKERLGWMPVLSLEDTVRMTVEWYRDFRKLDAGALAVRQITEYEELCRKERMQ